MPLYIKGWATLALEIHRPAEITFNPNQTHQHFSSTFSRLWLDLQVCLVRAGAKLGN